MISIENQNGKERCGVPGHFARINIITFLKKQKKPHETTPIKHKMVYKETAIIAFSKIKRNFEINY